MAESQLSVPISEVRNILQTWIKPTLDKKASSWLSETVSNLLTNFEDWRLFSSFSAVPRYTGKDDLKLSENKKLKANELRDGWRPDTWSIDEMGRTVIVLAAVETDKEIFLERLEKIFVSSDMGEAEALYKALPILPFPEALQDRAAEGIRSNMDSVFNAVALNNPYPADYFDEGAWNQLVLKALFVQSPLYKIYGIDHRRNEKLAHMLVDYAHERWAAGRTVSPELWRPVGRFASGKILKDLQCVLEHEDLLQQQAAVLALSASSDPEVKQLIAENQEILDDIKKKNITWDKIGSQAAPYRSNAEQN